jgi:hypothetical protein
VRWYTCVGMSMQCSLAVFGIGALIVSATAVSPCKADDVSAVITGYVYSQDGDPVENATVFAYLQTSDSAIEYTQSGQALEYSFGLGRVFQLQPAAMRSSNRDGFFVFLGMLPGHYTLIARAQGWQQGGCWPSTSIHPNQTWHVTVWMIPPSTHSDCFSTPSPEFGISF